MENLEHTKPEDVVTSSAAEVFVIFLIANNQHFSWDGQGFSDVSIDNVNGFLSIKGIKKEIAVNEFYRALSSAKNMPFKSGNLQIVPLPSMFERML